MTDKVDPVRELAELQLGCLRSVSRAVVGVLIAFAAIVVVLLLVG